MNEERDSHLGELIDRRVQVYGDPVETFARIAQVWSGILGHEVQAWQVPLCMVGMKMVRATQAPDYSDNPDDMDGYVDIFRKIIGPDMIDARSVNEFIEKKWGRPETQAEKDFGFDEEPIPYQLSEDERAQHLRRAETVTDEPCHHSKDCRCAPFPGF